MEEKSQGQFMFRLSSLGYRVSSARRIYGDATHLTLEG
jgi:hypothetical protein